MKRIYLPVFLLANVLAAHSQSWTNQFNGDANLADSAKAMVVDTAGNVIVTGSSEPAPFFADCVTVKYSASGVPLWTNRYAAPNGYAEPAGIAGDAAGNTFLAVRQGMIVKYPSAGLPIWTNHDLFGQGTIEGIAVDSSGNVCITGGDTTTSFLTVKYSNDGLPLWTNRHNAPDGTGGAGAIKVDSNDNVIIVGTSGGTNYTFAAIKYSASGSGLWTNETYRVSGLSQLSGMAVDGQGNVFLTGLNGISGVSQSLDVLTVKYSSTGTLHWSQRFNSPGNDEDVPRGLAVDRDGNVIVVGYAKFFGSLTLKYSGEGVPLWTNYYATAANAVTADRNGNVFVTGQDDAADAAITFAYSSTGAPLWTNHFAGPAYSAAIAVDHLGNVFVAGGISNNGQPFSQYYDYWTIKYAVGISPPLLNIQRLGNSVVLSWPNAAFGLQSAPAITGAFTNIPGATNPFTNAISGGQRFFRLVQ